MKSRSGERYNLTDPQNEHDWRQRQVTFRLKACPPLSNASKMLISDGEMTSGSVGTTNYKNLLKTNHKQKPVECFICYCFVIGTGTSDVNSKCSLWKPIPA